MYNVDETAITIPKNRRRYLDVQEKNNVGIITSAEKGHNVTVVCYESAAESYAAYIYFT
jgi:bifunctional DNA-binding transcriptional regulator/antitoxin component of YhaV-PrlF toxin-antitoxin module